MGFEINGKSPQAIRMLKYAFNLPEDGLVGQQLFAGEATRLAYMTDEAVEGRDAFLEKRDPTGARSPATSSDSLAGIAFHAQKAENRPRGMQFRRDQHSHDHQRNVVWPWGDFANAMIFVGDHPEHLRPPAPGVEDLAVVVEIPFAVILFAPRIGELPQHLVAGDPLSAAFDDDVDAVLPPVDTGGDGDIGVVGQVVRLLLVAAGAEHEALDPPTPRPAG